MGHCHTSLIWPCSLWCLGSCTASADEIYMYTVCGADLPKVQLGIIVTISSDYDCIPGLALLRTGPKISFGMYSAVSTTIEV